MSEQESLRLAAEVVDNFSPTMKRLRAQMQDMAKAGAEHTEAVAKGFGRLETGMKGAASAASSILTPALAAVGVTGLSVAATIAGIGAAVRNFGGSAKELGQLSRDSGIAASTLRNIQGVLSGVGVDAATSGQALQKFAEDARLAARGHGQMIEFLRRQGTNEEGRKYFNNLADDIMRSKNAGEMLEKAFKGMEGVEGPINKRIYAENVLKLAEAARVADGRLGTFEAQIKRFQRNNGVITDQDIKDAEDYARAMDGLKGQMDKLYNAAARELTPVLTDAARAVKAFMDDQRNGVQTGLVKAIQDVKTELGKIDWATAGKGALDFLRETTNLSTTLARNLKDIVELWRDLMKGDYVEALRKSTGGGGTVGRAINQLYPRQQKVTPEGEALDAQMRGQTMSPEELQGNQNLRRNAGRVAEIEARMGELHTKLDQFGLMEKSGTTSDRSRAQAEDLRREMTRLTDELKRIREGTATVQQQSFDGTGGGLAGLIQKASYGGGPAVAAVGRIYRGYGLSGGSGYGGGSGPGYSGEQGASPFPRMPKYEPDHPVNQAGRLARGEPQFAEPPGGGYTGNDGRRASRSGMTAAGRARVASWMEFLMRPVSQGGEGMSREVAMGHIATMQGESGLNLNPGDMGDKDKAGVPHAFGTAQWSDAKGNPRFPLLQRYAASQGKHWTDLGVQQQYHRMEMLGLPGAVSHRRAYDAMMRAGTGEGSLREGIDKFENPQKKALAYQIRKPFLDRLRRDQAGLSPSDVDQIRGAHADGAAWAQRERARKEFEASKPEHLRRPDFSAAVMDAQRAADANRLARYGSTLQANGSVVVNVHKAAPDTRVSTTASGRLFQDVKIASGRQMQKADD